MQMRMMRERGVPLEQPDLGVGSDAQEMPHPIGQARADRYFVATGMLTTAAGSEAGDVGVRATPPQGRPVRLDGHRRRRPLQTPSPSRSFASLQCELLDRYPWPTRAGLARSMFARIEAWYNPIRRHSTLGYLSPVDYENTAASAA